MGIITRGEWMIIVAIVAAAMPLVLNFKSVEGYFDDQILMDSGGAVFVFGDSTVDVGTNNYLNKSLAKANNPYYGIDYPYSISTGRFSNGYNIADLIVRSLGGYKRSPPPFLSLLNRTSTFKSAILRGVNFASGGSGILNQTGNHAFIEVIPMSQQVQQFASVSGNITEELSSEAATDFLSKSLFIISVGSNDLLEYANATRSVTPNTFLTNLMASYATHLEGLYNLGARRFGILSSGPLGCLPVVRHQNKSGGCIDELNDLSQAFYTSTRLLLETLSSQAQGRVKYSFGNIYNMTMNTILSGAANGFDDISTACCGDAVNVCESGAKLCSDRRKILFWDKYHPTQAACEKAALILVFSESPDFVTPLNFSQLATAPLLLT